MKATQVNNPKTTTWTPWGPQPVLTFRAKVAEAAVKRALRKAKLAAVDAKMAAALELRRH